MNSRPQPPDRRPQVLVIVGPTATGKSQLALEIAKKIPSEIISADSMQVYKGMDIATAKASPGIRRQVKHHLIDVISVKEPFNAVSYQKMARQAISEITLKKKLPIIVGGTGLYIRAAIYRLEFPKKATDDTVRQNLENKLKDKGLVYLQKELKQKDTVSYRSIDINNSRRVIRALEIIEVTGKLYSDFRHDWHNWQPLYNNIVVGLTMPRDLLYKRIEQRVDSMIEAGLLQEAKRFVKESLKEAIIAKQALGYKELIDYLDGCNTLDQAVELLKKRTRNYAKRQHTWFKKDPNIRWFDASKKSMEQIAESVLKLLRGRF